MKFIQIFGYLLIGVLQLTKRSFGQGSGNDVPPLFQDDFSSSGDLSQLCSSASCLSAVKAITGAMNRSVDPCDDFYQFACGTFLATQKILPGKSRMNQFTIMDQAIKKQLRGILETNPPPENEPQSRKKARQYYAACIDLESTVRNAPAQIMNMVNDLGGLFLTTADVLPRNWDLTNLLVKVNNLDVFPLFGTVVELDVKNVSANGISIYQAGLGLGDDTRDYYMNKNVTDDEILVAYADLLVEYVKILLGDDYPINRDFIVDIIILEQRLSEIQQTIAEQLDNEANYNKVTVSWLQRNAGFINWSRFMNGIFSIVNTKIPTNRPVIAYATNYLRNLSLLIEEYQRTPGGNRTLQNYATFLALGEFAPKCGGALEKASADFDAIFAGKQGLEERWEFCIDDLDGTIGFPLNAIYIEQNFPASAKEQAKNMVAHIYQTFRPRIQQANWMRPSTKRNALQKLAGLTFEVAYPDWLLNDTYLDKRYKKLNVTDDYALNQIEATKFGRLKHLNKLLKSPDKHEWGMTPPTVNAYNQLDWNKFVIPAGVLHPPLYYTETEIALALSYGAIGSIISHEITHTFDSSGRQFGKDGSLSDWWDEETSKRFNNKTACLVEKFDRYEINGIHIKGDQTLGENIADDGGVKISFQAYQKAVKDADASQFSDSIPGLDFTEEQLFFLGWGQAWCSVVPPEAMKLDITQDTHSPSKFRVNGPLSDFDEFAKAFHCERGRRMNPVNKCNVW